MGDDEGPRPLEYRSIRADQASCPEWHVGAGFCVAVAIAVVANCMGLANSPRLLGPPPVSAVPVATAVAGGLAVTAVWALAVQRRPRWRKFAAGLWIGVGTMALLEGVCFRCLW